jgi:anti-sigma regulatory factor (Ser/Thr protein kinase)
MPAPRQLKPWFSSVTVPSRVESIRLVAGFMMQAARTMNVTAAWDAQFEMAIVEALNNAVKHGNPEKHEDAFMVCELEIRDRTLILRIIDQGPGYTLPQTPRPDWDPDDIMTVPESGYGVAIINGIFPTVRTIGSPGAFGLEMRLPF